MAKIQCTIEEIDLEGDYGTVESVSATCPKCQHRTESYGTDESSIKRCLVLLNRECPRGENNYYVRN